jgi:hypothetical protein
MALPNALRPFQCPENECAKLEKKSALLFEPGVKIKIVPATQTIISTFKTVKNDGDDSNLVESRELKEGALSWNDFHNIEKEVPS